MFTKILIANRGEIACRIARTANNLGIATVGVYSRADGEAMHVRCCDEAIFIGDAAPAASYLCAERIIDAALQSGAQAVHPGYGFLSENAEFAEACAGSNLTFVGPPAAAIRKMGDKCAAKEVMQRAGVAVLPGYQGAAQDAEALAAAAEKVNYPLLIKAVAGGGGRGMRAVHNADEFADALAAVKREAAAAFGDDRVLLEKYLPNARHIEVQVFADTHGNAVHLFERDCSIQRRFQKIIEEAPAPGLADSLRVRLGETAVAAARAIHYVGAGTVEFLLDGDAFYFMEMNTRLQVEHAVTEMVCGVDLVEWQLLAAAGAALPRRQEELGIRGHAIEARVCAENAARGFLPASGKLAVYRQPAVHSRLRIDSGFAEGDAVPAQYDSLLAKVITHGDCREEARRRMHLALAAFDIVGVANNLDFLQSVVALDDFVGAKLDTNFLPRNEAALFASRTVPLPVLATAAWLQTCAVDSAGDDVFAPAVPWQMHLAVDVTCEFVVDGAAVEYAMRFAGGEAFVRAGDGFAAVRVTALGGDRYRVQVGGRGQTVTAYQVGDAVYVNDGDARYELALPAADDSTVAAAAGDLRAPMHATVVAVAAVGKTVKRGEVVVTLEAMKMEHAVVAPVDGVVEEVFCGVGEAVAEGEVLAGVG